MSQSDLLQLLDLPIQPLRDALRVLETEGILKVHPRSGIEFLKADLELARSTYQFRPIIERSAARTYAETAESADIAALIAAHHAVLERVQAEGATDEVNEAMEELEQRFHSSMIAALREPDDRDDGTATEELRRGHPPRSHVDGAADRPNDQGAS